MTPEQLADAAGISASELSLIENGNYRSNTDTMISLAQSLNIPLEEIEMVALPMV